jgi:N-acetylmuramoyl-L-alanine amidase
MKLAAGSRGIEINGVKLVLLDEVKEKEGVMFLSRKDLSGLLEPILRPGAIKVGEPFDTVVIDPAFGGKNQGASGEWGTAAEHSLAIAKIAKEELEKMGIKVVMTREEDQDQLQQDRVRIANGVNGSAIFINLTFGSGPPDKGGVSTFTLIPSENPLGAEGLARSNASTALGMAVHGSVMRRLGGNTEDRGLERINSSGLPEVKWPGISVNAGYLTHPYEGKLAANEKYRTAVAKGVVDGVQKYRAAVSRR